MKTYILILIMCTFSYIFVGCTSDTENVKIKNVKRNSQEAIRIVFNQDTLDMSSTFYHSGDEQLKIKFAFAHAQDSLEWKTLVENILPKIGYFGKQTFEDFNSIYFYKNDTTHIYNLDSIGGVSVLLFAKNRSLHHRFYLNTDGEYSNIPEFNAEKTAGTCMRYDILLDQYIYSDAPKDRNFTLLDISYSKKKTKMNPWGLNMLQLKIDKLWEKRIKELNK